jgi:hypothetical protein
VQYAASRRRHVTSEVVHTFVSRHHLAVLWWSIATGLHALAGSALWFGVLRFCMGAGEIAMERTTGQPHHILRVLVVSATQVQPNLDGSNFTLLSTVLNLHRQNQFASRPLEFNSQLIPRAAQLRSPQAIRLSTASAVVQHPSGSSPVNAGQLPSLF